MSKSLRHKMKNVDVGRYNEPKLSFPVIMSSIFWFFVSDYFYRYNDYLKSYVWKYRRKKVLIRDNFACVICGSSKGKLDVHHLTYDRVCKERLEDLRTVCRYHHRKLHS